MKIKKNDNDTYSLEGENDWEKDLIRYRKEYKLEPIKTEKLNQSGFSEEVNQLQEQQNRDAVVKTNNLLKILTLCIDKQYVEKAFKEQQPASQQQVDELRKGNNLDKSEQPIIYMAKELGTTLNGGDNQHAGLVKLIKRILEALRASEFFESLDSGKDIGERGLYYGQLYNADLELEQLKKVHDSEIFEKLVALAQLKNSNTNNTSQRDEILRTYHTLVIKDYLTYSGKEITKNAEITQALYTKGSLGKVDENLMSESELQRNIILSRDIGIKAQEFTASFKERPTPTAPEIRPIPSAPPWPGPDAIPDPQPYDLSSNRGSHSKRRPRSRKPNNLRNLGAVTPSWKGKIKPIRHGDSTKTFQTREKPVANASINYNTRVSFAPSNTIIQLGTHTRTVQETVRKYNEDYVQPASCLRKP